MMEYSDAGLVDFVFVGLAFILKGTLVLSIFFLLPLLYLCWVERGISKWMITFNWLVLLWTIFLTFFNSFVLASGNSVEGTNLPYCLAYTLGFGVWGLKRLESRSE